MNALRTGSGKHENWNRKILDGFLRGALIEQSVDNSHFSARGHDDPVALEAVQRIDNLVLRLGDRQLDKPCVRHGRKVDYSANRLEGQF